ncbi:hypothetical protein CROQUDRAFT_662919 [Cronartium quercuum f. sp. fusiforme G11]|uniref:HAT C-terminal dimerisation domain-containing protein n=1 Tax=Cronartium quercuum f. sp. fusiforme G11 TaxID=708437 RepID=A0A9P6N8Z9_9BASI|nr:hypothetical protein CROQUDRAFT_662919 [Cronartium quercuum f. sp. fusiforme G11]
MDFMLPILTRIEEATQIFQSDAPTKHCVIPVYKLIEHTLSQYSFSTWLLGASMSKTIFSHCGFPIAVENKAKSLLLNEYNLWLSSQNQHPNISEPSKVAKPVPSMIHGMDWIYASLEAAVGDTTLTDMPTKFYEVKSYLAGENSSQAGEAIGAFWMCMIVSNIYPILGQIVLQLLSISASSAFVEHIFSVSNGIATPAQPCLSPETISKLVSIWYWTEINKATMNVSKS